jgi:hypothetical protein
MGKKDFWFEEKKHFLFRDLVSAYITVKAFFDDLARQYKKQGNVEFERLEYLVGTETDRGVLWNLKDSCHFLFRRNDRRISPSEYLFDWSVGSIFHEAMKLKEDAYQMEAYVPNSEMVQLEAHEANGPNLLREYSAVLDRVSTHLRDEVANIEYLFSKASAHLKEILLSHSDNGLLMRYLITHKELVDEALRPGGLGELLTLMYGRNIDRAYVAAGKSCVKGGWYREAASFFKNSLVLNPTNEDALKGLESAKRMQAIIREKGTALKEDA